MTESMDRIKKTIRDLLNLANNDAAFEQEAENALRFARKLMLRHGLDQSDCEQERDVHQVAAAADVEYGLKHCFSEAATLSKWEEQLANTICNIIGTIKWYKQTKIPKRTKHGTLETNPRTGSVQKASTMSFYGPDEDCVSAVDLLDEWRQIIIAMARLKYGGVFKGPGRSYCEGFAYELLIKTHKIRDEEQAAKKALDGDRSYALMVINSGAIALAKKEKASTWLKDVQGIKLRAAPQTSYRKHHGGAYADGKTDGRKANLPHSRRKRLG